MVNLEIERVGNTDLLLKAESGHCEKREHFFRSSCNKSSQM